MFQVWHLSLHLIPPLEEEISNHTACDMRLYLFALTDDPELGCISSRTFLHGFPSVPLSTGVNLAVIEKTVSPFIEIEKTVSVVYIYVYIYMNTETTISIHISTD